MNKLKQVALKMPGFAQDSIFDAQHRLNFDDRFRPYILLQQQLLAQGVEIHTDDLLAVAAVDLEVHVNVQNSTRDCKKILLALETEFIHPANGDQAALNNYLVAMGWDKRQIDVAGWQPLNFSNPIESPKGKPFEDRSIFCTMIAGNKAVQKATTRELYSERVKTIRWFEQHHPESFVLFGTGWHRPAKRPGLFGSVLSRVPDSIITRIAPQPFPSYQGAVDAKADVLSNAKFVVCYENIADIPGYLTEKIFDCLLFGAIPIYWGDLEVTDVIPAACFIDRRAFKHHEALFEYLTNMNTVEAACYQQAAADFLNSTTAQQYSHQTFADRVTQAVLDAL